MARNIAVRIVIAAALAAVPSPVAAQVDSTPPSVSITSPAAGQRVGRNVTITAAVTDSGKVASVTFRVDGAVVGTDSKAPYSVRWNTKGVADGAHTIRADARDAAGNVGTSAPIAVIVGEVLTSPADTTPPTVSITAPSGGAQVTGTVAVSASASDAVGVTSVTFFVDGTAIGTDTSSPYSVSWNSTTAAAGSHTFRAEARDAAGNVGVSAPISATIAASNRPPSVTMTTTAASYVAPAALTLTATASDSDGTVSRVDFYEGSTVIGSDSANPFTLAWTASSARTYVFSAVAVDNQGAATTSASVSITITAPTRPSTAVFEPSADNASVTQYVLDIFVAGSNPATAAPVATQNLGKPPVVAGEMSADIRSTTALLASGSYIATVTAVTSMQQARSAASPAFSIVSSTASVASSAGRLAGAVSPISDSPLTTRAEGVLWVANAATGLVTAFNATTGDVLATIPVGLRPAGIAGPDGAGKVYVADEGSDTVSVISRATMSVIRTIALPPPYGRQPHHVSDSPDGRFVYIGESGANVVDVIATASDEIVGRYATGWPGSKTRAVVSDPEGTVLYAVNRGAAPSPSTLVALDAGTGQWLWQLALAGDPADLLVSADGRFGMIVRQTDGRMDVIDLEQHAVVKTIDLGTDDVDAALQLAPDGRVAIVAPGTTATQATLVDMASMAAVASVSLGAAIAGTTLPAQQLAYVTVPGNSEVPTGIIAIDVNTRAVVRRFRFPGGGSPAHAVVTD
jgi:YVTN family beta-propeller protein